MNVFKALIFTICCFWVLACGTDPNTPPPQSQNELREPLIHANKARLKMENLKINKYTARHNLEMEVTGTGLRYLVYEKGDGPQPAKGQTAIINYVVSLMDGTVCYRSETDGTRGFEIGKAEIEKGLDEGILLLGVGDKAKFILPSHLAHGLAGDGNKIPSHAVLIYDVTLIDIK